MVSILDRLMSGTTGLFAGPRLTGAPEGSPDPGAREGLISAGLQTIIASNNGATTLEALAMGAQAGRGAGAVARQDFATRQARGEIEGYLKEQGYDRQNLTSAAFQLMAQGDMKGAQAVFNILQSLPRPLATAAGVNLRNVEMTVGEIRRQGGEVDPGLDDTVIMRVPENPRTLERNFDAATVKPDTRITGIGQNELGEFRHFVKHTPEADPIWGEIARDPGGAEPTDTFQERLNNRLAAVAGGANAMFEPYQLLVGSIPIAMANSRSASTAWLGRMMASEDALVGNTYRAGILNPTVRWLSGAQMNMDEARRYDTMLFLQAGEPDYRIKGDPTSGPSEVAKAKARMRAMLIAAMGNPVEYPGYEFNPELTDEQNKLRARAYVDTIMEQIQGEAMRADWDPYEIPPDEDLGAFGDLPDAAPRGGN